MGISINPGNLSSTQIDVSSSAADLLPAKTRSYQTGDAQLFGQGATERPSFGAEKLPYFPPPRPQKSASDTPFNSAKDIFETTIVKLPGGAALNVRRNDGGSLTGNPGSSILPPSGGSANVVQAEVKVPVVSGPVTTLDLKGRIDSGQNTGFGPELNVKVGDANLNASFYLKQPLQTVGDESKRRDEFNVGFTQKLNDVTVGLNVTQTTGGTARKNGTTRIELPVTANLGGENGTQVQVTPSVTFNDKTNSVATFGGSITVQPVNEDNTKPQTFAGVKFNENLSGNASDQSASVYFGRRF